MPTALTLDGANDEWPKLVITFFTMEKKTMEGPKPSFWDRIDVKKLQRWIAIHVAVASAETLQWIGIILIHAATIPTLLAVLTGLSDRMPPMDMVLLIWAGLTAIFVQAAVINNRLILITISLGFMIQSVLMALIFFK
jgi:hypothetical protein